MKRVSLIFLIGVFYTLGSRCYGQSITWGPTLPAGTVESLTVLVDDGLAQFEFVNDATALTNGTIEIDLGIGVTYLAGTLSYTTSNNAVLTELSSTGDNLVIIEMGSVDANEQIFFSFKREAICEARTHKLSGGTFK